MNEPTRVWGSPGFFELDDGTPRIAEGAAVEVDAGGVWILGKLSGSLRVPKALAAQHDAIIAAARRQGVLHPA